MSQRNPMEPARQDIIEDVLAARRAQHAIGPAIGAELVAFDVRRVLATEPFTSLRLVFRRHGLLVVVEVYAGPSDRCLGIAAH